MEFSKPPVSFPYTEYTMLSITMTAVRALKEAGQEKRAMEFFKQTLTCKTQLELLALVQQYCTIII